MTADVQPDNDHDDATEEVDLIEELRRLDPVDIDALPSSRSPEALRTLEQILGPGEDTQPETEAPGTEAHKTGVPECSPATDDRGGREEPPPCPTSR